MSETRNPIFPKIINRGNDGDLSIGGMKGKVEYTSQWDPVEGGKGATCRTWKIQGVDADVDGADIKIEKSGNTPIQLVNAANVVVDAPEFGKGWCCIMAPDGKMHTNYFDDSSKKQMVWDKGMLIVWVAKEPMGVTEFESPAFNEGMFINISDDQGSVSGYPKLNLKKIQSGS